MTGSSWIKEKSMRKFRIAMILMAVFCIPGLAVASEDIKFDGTIINATAYVFTKQGEHLDHGKWCSEPANIASGQTGAFCAQGTQGSAVGTQGSVTYSIGNSGTNFTVGWDLPYSADPHYPTCSVSSSSFTCTISLTSKDCGLSFLIPHCRCAYKFTIQNRP
jgi:hypothetical protein